VRVLINNLSSKKRRCKTVVSCLPSFFHQKISNLIMHVIRGKINCNTSIISIKLLRVLNNERAQGNTPTVKSINRVRSMYKLHFSFSRGSSSVLGHNPIIFKLMRFSFTAHSKSTCRSFGKLKLLE